ncbi:MAG: protein phosphatase 2C domain-containing protein, partial [Acidimicrobiales bacterium]
MSSGWSGPAWGEPSRATASPVPLRTGASAAAAAYRADGGVAQEFAVLAASVAGVSHRLAGRRCEDSWGWVQPAPGRLALVVADGVSGAGRGGEGADQAVDAACASLLGCPGAGWGEVECSAAISAASQELLRAGGGAAAEFSTTLVVALISLGPDGADVCLGRVGDSTAYSLSAGEWEELFGYGEATYEMLSTATNVLPFTGAGAGAGEDASAGAGTGQLPVGGGPRVAPGAVVPGEPGPAGRAGEELQPVSLAPGERVPGELRSMSLPPGAALVLMTDGVANPLRDGPGTVAPALAAVLAGAGSEGSGTGLAPLELAHALDFSRRGALDDRTVAVAWP